MPTRTLLIGGSPRWHPEKINNQASAAIGAVLNISCTLPSACDLRSEFAVRMAVDELGSTARRHREPVEPLLQPPTCLETELH
jgi:hypothetical protein